MTEDTAFDIYAPHMISHREPIVIHDLALKVYRFASFTDDMDPHGFLTTAIGMNYGQMLMRGRIGTAFLYSYQKDGPKVRGLDMTLYEHEGITVDNPGHLDMPPNPMLATWTIEDMKGSHYQKLDRSDDGTRCSVEDIISGRETEALFRMVLENEGEVDIRRFLNEWPDLGYANQMLLDREKGPYLKDLPPIVGS